MGAIGLIGSLIVAGLGQGWAGFGIAVNSLGGLVSIFVLGQNEQRKNMEKNAKVRTDMTQRKPIEEIDAERGSVPKKTAKTTANKRVTQEPKTTKQPPKS